MAAITTADDVKKLGTILAVWAHPDDESFCCAGLLAAAVKNGQTVVCITATKGEMGIQDESRWPADKLGEIRTQELEDAMGILGLNDHHWLGYKDGECKEVAQDEAVKKIKGVIDTHWPDTILTFGPDGLTGHPDHQTVSQWVSLASDGSDITIYHAVEDEEAYGKYLKDLDERVNFYFNIDKPPLVLAEDCDIAFRLTDELIKQKYDALKAQPSQTEAMFKSMPPHADGKIFTIECFVKAPPPH